MKPAITFLRAIRAANRLSGGRNLDDMIVDRVVQAAAAFLVAADAALGTPFARCYGEERERALEILLNPPA